MMTMVAMPPLFVRDGGALVARDRPDSRRPGRCTATVGRVPDLVLLRHGQSVWNAEGLFTGWVDVDLSARGEVEAREAGRLLAAEQDRGLDLRVLHTSVLTRAVRTANLALDEMGTSWIPVRRHWRLNERHYGALQGRNKKEMTAEYGIDQVKLWRRSYSVPPPPWPSTTSATPSTTGATARSRPPPSPGPNAWPMWWPG